MSSRTRRVVRSDVPTRSTGYEEEMSRVRASRVADAVRGDRDREEIAARDTSTESETPILEEAAEASVATQPSSPTTAVDRDVDADQEIEASTDRDQDVADNDQEVAEERLPDQLYSEEEARKLGMQQAKTVSAEAMKRLVAAKNAINHTKQVLEFGGGNQYDALKDSNFNSYFRMQVMRDPECWEMHPGIRDLAMKYPDALTAAKADLAQGGNCGEHAQVAFDFLRQYFSGDTVNRCDVAGLDHAFIILGNVMGEASEDLVVSDPWPTAPTACLWTDHFAFTPEKSKINVRNSAQGDPAAVKEALAKGIRLSAKGKQMIEMQLSEDKTEEELDKGTDSSKGHNWIWRHSDTTSGSPMNYKQAGNS